MGVRAVRQSGELKILVDLRYLLSIGKKRKPESSENPEFSWGNE